MDTKLPSQSPLPCLKKKLQTKLVSFIIEAGLPWPVSILEQIFVVIVKPGKLETLRLLFNFYDTVDY